MEVSLIGGALRSRAQNAALGVADRAAAKAHARKGKKKQGFMGKGLGNPANDERSQEGTTIQSNEDSYLSAGLGKTNYLYDATGLLYYNYPINCPTITSYYRFPT